MTGIGSRKKSYINLIKTRNLKKQNYKRIFQKELWGGIDD